MGATLRSCKRSEGGRVSDEYQARSAVPQFHEQWTTRESNRGPTYRDNSRNCGSGAIWRTPRIFHGRPTREHRLELATEPGRLNVCLHFRGGRNGRSSGCHSDSPFTRTRICRKKYLCSNHSSWTGSWKAPRGREAGPGKRDDVDECVDELAQRRRTNLRAIVAQAYQRGSR